MINFRYHVVSLTAVFLALAVGLVLGTAALNGTVQNQISEQVSGLRNSNGQLRDQVEELQARAASQDEFTRQIAPVLLAGKLTGKSVLVVSGPTADNDERDKVVDMLKKAGATITGEMRLRKDFTDPNKDDALQDLTARVTPPAVTTLPNNGVGVETASALLATVLLANKAPITPDSRTRILTGYESLGVLDLEGKVSDVPPTAVVIVAGAPETGSDAEDRNTAFLEAVKQFDVVASQMVLAAPTAAGAGNPVAAVRDDGTLAKTISTVDGVSLAEGQVATAMALTEQFTGRAGHYGTGSGASARIPTLRS
ncbi:copper transporter [Cryptosporangium aurantiacum]|uniref:Copper transport outer membrane protein, MctB n=1 Tax=Cryptosporangium aurantiacum TaxID=134849 RepID=A0A1M7RNM5_9ACTN|nr:copper transporter [Cryptosporangium aurantiacum]SHN47854.1 Copper transport outer membrane protein, MctB [Cryptosporangium aurantiacum]